MRMKPRFGTEHSNLRSGKWEVTAGSRELHNEELVTTINQDMWDTRSILGDKKCIQNLFGNVKGNLRVQGKIELKLILQK